MGVEINGGHFFFFENQFEGHQYYIISSYETGWDISEVRVRWRTEGQKVEPRNFPKCRETQKDDPVKETDGTANELGR